jgi:antitoxin (DNA-binding transcriptional repressor) of toxin-antitoxin stability system
MVKTVTAEELARNFESVLEEDDRVLVEKGGRVVASLLPTIAQSNPQPWMTKVSAAEFRQNCAAFIDKIENGGGVVLIEKDGLIVTRLVAIGPMYGTVRYEGDIVSPVVDPDDWTADEDNVLGIDRS